MEALMKLQDQFGSKYYNDDIMWNDSRFQASL